MLKDKEENRLSKAKDSSESKKPRKRKRKTSKREPDDGYPGEENQTPIAAGGFTPCNGEKLEHTPLGTSQETKKKKSLGVKASKKNIKKKPLGLKVGKTNEIVSKIEKPSTGKKKKRKKWGKNDAPNAQETRTEIEGFAVLNGGHEMGSNSNVDYVDSDKNACDLVNDNSNIRNVSSNYGLGSAKSKKRNKRGQKGSKVLESEISPFYSITNQKRGIRLTAKEKKELAAEEMKEARAAEENDKQNMIEYPVCMFHVSKDRSIVVLTPGQSMYLHGLLSVRPLVGEVKILGYKLKELEEQIMYSFNSHALLSVQAAEGCKFCASKHSYVLDYGLTKEQLENIADNQTGPVVVVEFKRCNVPIVKQLSVIGEQQLMIPKVRRSGALWGMWITLANCQRYNLIVESSEWKETLENICLSHECGNAPRVIVCGGKGVGKSTFFKYVVNGLLNKKGTKVQCLDIDPGQTELAVPSCVSLTKVTEPLLGPSYTHLFDGNLPDVKQITIGCITPQFGLQRYLKAIKELVKLSKEEPDCPLVVNTMGWTMGTGLDLILDTIRIVRPTHVIQIQNPSGKNNYECLLNRAVVKKTIGGIITKAKAVKGELFYSFTELTSKSGRRDVGVSFTPKVLRELTVLVHFSSIISDYLSKGVDQGGKSRNIVIVEWPEVVIHVCGTNVPKQRVLQVLNGNLVALCQVDSSKIESVSPDLPKYLIDDLDFGQCIGWGVIRGIDPLTKELHILTTLSSEEVSQRVNAIIKPDLHLPDKFYGFFTKGEGPYYQKMCRSGAGRLKVERQIKPGMATFGGRKHD